MPTAGWGSRKAVTRWRDLQNAGTQPTYVLTMEVSAEPKAVAIALADPDTPQKLHPLIVGAEVLEHEVDDDGSSTAVIDFTDQVKICGCIPWTVKYRAYLVGMIDGLPDDGDTKCPTVLACASVSGTNVVHHYQCIASKKAGVTIVRDAVYIEAPAPVRSYVEKTARVSHVESLAKLPALFDDSINAD